MDKYEQRRLNLEELVERLCGGKMAELANKLDRSASYVSRMLYEEGKEGKKRIGEDMAELITQAFGLRKGWLDVPHGPHEIQVDQVTQDASIGGRDQKSIAEVVKQVTAMVTLKIISEKEADILISYRSASADGRRDIEDVAILAEREQLAIAHDQAKS